MTADEILAKRECWIDETFNRLQKDLVRKPDMQREDEMYVHTDEKLVTIYGTPQIGKTTLILALMGIAPNYRGTRCYEAMWLEVTLQQLRRLCIRMLAVINMV